MLTSQEEARRQLGGISKPTLQRLIMQGDLDVVTVDFA
jgi:hypothetical protein